MSNYTLIRNGEYRRSEIRGINAHNERLKEEYRNPDINPSRSELNVHFRQPSGLYTAVLDQLVSEKKVSTRGLKDDAILFANFCSMSIADISKITEATNSQRISMLLSIGSAVKKSGRTILFPPSCTPTSEIEH